MIMLKKILPIPRSQSVNTFTKRYNNANSPSGGKFPAGKRSFPLGGYFPVGKGSVSLGWKFPVGIRDLQVSYVSVISPPSTYKSLHAS